MKKNNLNISTFQTGNALTIGLSHLLHDIYSSFLSPLLPLLISKFSLSYKMASLLTMMQNLPAILSLFVGIVADKVRMRYLVIITPAITAITMSLLGVAPAYSLLVILTIVMGLSSAFFHVPTPVMIKKVSGDRIGKGMSFYMLGGEIARTLGPLAIIGAVSVWGLEGTYRLMPFGIFASVFMYFRLRKINISEDISKEQKLTGLKTLLKPLMPLYFKLGGYLLCRAVMKFALTAFLPTYLTYKGYSLWFSGAALSILQVGSVAGTYLSGTLSDKFGRKPTLILIALVSPVLMWLFISLNNVFFLFPLLILIGLTHFSTDPVLLAYVQDIKSDRPALLNSIYMTITFGIGSLAVGLVGILSDWLGLELTFKITAIIALAGIPFIFALKPENNNTK